MRTRADFRCFCAYCFRHEDELGGQGHFDQDHFEPKSVNNGAKERVFLNLYWCCKDCNSRQNKGSTWPSAGQLLLGECFCDPCHHDPEVVDYSRQEDMSLLAKTASGGYTIRILRLNERSELRKLLIDRDRVRREYQQRLEQLRSQIRRADQIGLAATNSTIGAVVEVVRRAIPDYEQFVNADPFVLTSFPEPIDTKALTDLM